MQILKLDHQSVISENTPFKSVMFSFVCSCGSIYSNSMNLGYLKKLFESYSNLTDIAGFASCFSCNKDIKYVITKDELNFALLSLNPFANVSLSENKRVKVKFIK